MSENRSLTTRDSHLRTIEDDREERQLVADLILPGATPAQLSLVLSVCRRYNLDPLLKQVVLIGFGDRKSLYITRDGLIRVAHASGHFDGMQVTHSEQDAQGKWRVTVEVYRNDMRHPFRYTAMQEEHEQPLARSGNPGPWQKSPHAMTQKCAEVMALRRAFDVSLGSAEEVGMDAEAETSNIGQVYTVQEAVSAPTTHVEDADVEIIPPAPKPTPEPLTPIQQQAVDAAWDMAGSDTLPAIETLLLTVKDSATPGQWRTVSIERAKITRQHYTPKEATV